MLLDLFITHYQEPWEVGKKSFDILALQRLVDWNDIRITIVHDGTEAFPVEYFAGYPYRVKQVTIPHGGIAAARNWCIDHSTAAWIKWNDFDDMFDGIFSLSEIMNALRGARKFDMLWFRFWMEVDGKKYLREERDPVVLHGKILRRSFLIDHRIRFQENLTWCEDSAFLALVELEIDHQRIGEIKSYAPMYMYLKRDGSLCNRPEIWFENRKSFFIRHRYVCDQLRAHGKDREGDIMTVRIMGDAYYTLHEDQDVDPAEKEAHERDVWEYFKKNREAFLRVTNEGFKMAIDAVNNENRTDVSKANLLAWLKFLRLKYEIEKAGDSNG